MSGFTAVGVVEALCQVFLFPPRLDSWEAPTVQLVHCEEGNRFDP